MNSAEERLLDASLETLFGRQATVQRPASRLRPTLVAAIFVVAAGVVVATVVRQRSSDGSSTAVPAQEPVTAPLPPAIEATEAMLADVPADTENLTVRLRGPARLGELQRFTRLRRLQVLPVPKDEGDAGGTPRWEGALPVTALTPLELLASLEVLALPHDLSLRADHVATLQRLPRLRELTCSGGLVCGADTGRALAALPQLTSLAMSSTVVEPAFFTALAARPLRRLALHACPGLDTAAWRELARLTTLRHLEVASLHGGTVGVAGTTQQLGTLVPEAFDAFAVLPELRALLLDESAFDDRMLSRLPVRLERLDLGDRPMQSLAADALRRLGGLRDLTFGCGLDPEPAVQLLGALRLRRLDYRGNEVDAALLRAVAAQPDLEELCVRFRSSRLDLTPLATAPRLASLVLNGNSSWAAVQHRPTSEMLLPLRDCKALRRLRLVDCGLDGSATAHLGAGVEVLVEERN